MVEKHEAGYGSTRATHSTGLVDHNLNAALAGSHFLQNKKVYTTDHRQRTTTANNDHVRHERSTPHEGHNEQRHTKSGSDSTITAQACRNKHLPVDRSVASNGKPSGVTVRQLDKLIYQRMVKSADRNSDTRFMPINELDGTISQKNVELELDLPKNRKKITKLHNRWPKLMGLDIDSAHLARIVCKKPSRRKIFAILCCMHRAYAILLFIEEGVSDRDLPLRFDDELNGVVSRKETDEIAYGTIDGNIMLFQDASWSPRDLESFKDLQWRFLVPFFSLSYELGQYCEPQDLKSSCILPFVEDAPEAASLSESVALEGGFSFVRKVRIHQAHHNHWKNPRGRGLSYFAVKELKTRPIQGLNEVQSLMRFNEQPHEHLIRLLSTFVYKDSLHMIFHWADGNNLENFWVTTNAKPKEDIDFTRWMSKQISGLAEAIQRIHHCDNRLLSKSDKGKTHGRHGDLKPANILWFKHDPNNTNPESFGILKISDFGMADFHGPLSKSNVPASQVVGLTNGYRAPEFDNTRLISPRYDIWSFGCVLLEFAVWRTLDGYDGGINPFSVLRTKESTAVIPEDNFFNLRLDDKEEIIQAEAKPSVVSMFQKLRSHQSCTGFIRDLLECIEQDLLQLEPNDRAPCTAVMGKLQAINVRCKSDQEYCRATVRITRNECPSGLTDSIPMDFSDRMKKLLNLQTADLNSRSQNQAKPNKEGKSDAELHITQSNSRREILIAIIIVVVFSASVLIFISGPSRRPI